MVQCWYVRVKLSLDGTVHCFLPFDHYSYRNPQHSRRPSFDELFEFLNSCDDDLLNWLKEDLDSMTSPHSQNIGCPLELGECLYKDLQKMYQGASSAM